jgi:hypothetical protein
MFLSCQGVNVGERLNVIDLFTRTPVGSPEHHAALIAELADLDAKCERDDRRREDIRRYLGLVAVKQEVSHE